MTKKYQSSAEIARDLNSDVENLRTIRRRREVQRNETSHIKWQEYNDLIDKDIDVSEAITNKLIFLHECGALNRFIQILSAQEAGQL